jgi:hypothetical protein
MNNLVLNNKKTILYIGVGLLIMGLCGYYRQMIILFILVLCYMFYNKYFVSSRDLINVIESFIDTYFKPDDEIQFIQELEHKIPSITLIGNVKNRLYIYIKNIEQKLQRGELLISSTMDFSDLYMEENIKILDNLFMKYYQMLYLLSDIDNSYSQQTMISFLDIQRHILREIHNFIFISPNNKLPDDLELIRQDIVSSFNTVNTDITNIHNTRSPENYNIYSSVLPEVNEPVAKNSYLDNRTPY